MGNKEELKAGLVDLLNSKGISKKNTNKVEGVDKKPVAKTRMENITANDQRTSLVIDKHLYRKIVQIAMDNGFSNKDVMNAAMRSFIERYEEKYGPITLPESKISADELI